MDRRGFLTKTAAVAAGLGLASQRADEKKPLFKISLAQWSLHRAFFGKKLDPIDFAKIAKNDYGISNIEYVNQFYKDKKKDEDYLKELKKRADGEGVRSVLIMCDGEANLGDSDKTKRMQAVENHYKWVDAAKYLGCLTIRVNAFGQGSAEDVQKAAIESLSELGEYAAQQNINVIVENHGGYTSNGEWMIGVMKGVDRKNVGVLPDFNNFCVKREGGQQWTGKCVEEYDRYKGVSEMMPYAKGASAKTIDFDANGNCVETDYYKMLKIIKDSGFHGYLGIEYEGEKASEEEGVRKTKALLEKVAATMS